MLKRTATRCVTFTLASAMALSLGTASASHNKTRPISIKLVNQAFQVQTKAQTVQQLMKEVGIPATTDLMVNPAPATKLKGLKEVSFPRLVMEIMEFPVEVPAPVKTVQVWDGSFGQSWQKTARLSPNQPGRAGKAILKSLYFFQDGKLLGFTEKTRILEPAKPAIVYQKMNLEGAQGNLKRFLTSNFRANKRDPGLAIPTQGTLPKGFRSRFAMTATAYTSDDPGVGTRTAMGWRLRQGIVAVDPRIIPMGTKLFIPGYGFGVAADTGGAIKGSRIDLAFGTRSHAFRFGRRKVDVYLLD